MDNLVHKDYHHIFRPYWLFAFDLNKNSWFFINQIKSEMIDPENKHISGIGLDNRVICLQVSGMFILFYEWLFCEVPLNKILKCNIDLFYISHSCTSTGATMNTSAYINTLRPRQNGRHFANDIFKYIFLNENVWISLKISLKWTITKCIEVDIVCTIHIMHLHIDSLVQDCSNSSALAVELLQSCTKPTICIIRNGYSLIITI